MRNLDRWPGQNRISMPCPPGGWSRDRKPDVDVDAAAELRERRLTYWHIARDTLLVAGSVGAILVGAHEAFGKSMRSVHIDLTTASCGQVAAYAKQHDVSDQDRATNRADFAAVWLATKPERTDDVAFLEWGILVMDQCGKHAAMPYNVEALIVTEAMNAVHDDRPVQTGSGPI